MKNNKNSISEFHEKFGNRVKDLRDARGYTQETLAELIEVDRSYMGFIERGERNPTLSRIMEISKILGVPLKELFDF